MKAKTIQEPAIPTFQPVTIALTFETQKELDTFGALFNYSPVCDLFRSIYGINNAPEEIRKLIVQNGGNLIAEYNLVIHTLK